MVAKHDLVIQGVIPDPVDGNTIAFIAAAPADYRTSFAGSALPFANREHAFEDTPNKGEVPVGANGAFTIPLFYPNSYYIGLGSVLIPPTLVISYVSAGTEKTINIEVAPSVPYRMLTHPPERTSTMFYAGDEDLPVRTQEQVLRDSAYPVKNLHPAGKFWGLKPRR